MLELLKNKKIMLVVAHPDDEVLGAGATINKLVLEYKSIIKVVILGEGLTSRTDTRDTKKWEKELEIHRKNIYDAKKTLQYQELSIYNLPDNRFDSVPLLDVVKIIEKEKRIFKPDFIFTHSFADLNIDHKTTFNAVITATRPMVDETVKGIISFEIPSATEWGFNPDLKFSPNLWIDINKQNLINKQKALNCYTFENRQFPHPRSEKYIEILTQKRGAEIGVNFAESFQIIRILTK